MDKPVTTPEGTTYINCVVLNHKLMRAGEKDKSKRLLDLIYLLEEFFPTETMNERNKYNGPGNETSATDLGSSRSHSAS